MTYTQNEELASLCDALGARLEGENYLMDACICYVCSSNLDNFVSCWQKLIVDLNSSASLQVKLDLFSRFIFSISFNFFLLTQGHNRESHFVEVRIEKCSSRIESILGKQEFIAQIKRNVCKICQNVGRSGLFSQRLQLHKRFERSVHSDHERSHIQRVGQAIGATVRFEKARVSIQSSTTNLLENKFKSSKHANGLSSRTSSQLNFKRS